MSDILLHIVGAGRAASVLAQGWRKRGVLRIGAVVNRSPASTDRALETIGAGSACPDLAELAAGIEQHPGRQWLLLGTPESALAGCAGELAAGLEQSRRRLELAFHLSGQRNARELAALGQCGIALASAHPVVSFARPATAARHLDGGYCLLEGDYAALEPLERCFSALGMRILIAPETMDKTAYHAALVLVSNELCALHFMAAGLLAKAGLNAADARALLASLGRGVTDSIAQHGALDALTGPLERGDQDASQRIAATFRRLPAHQRQASLALARVVIGMAEQKGSLDAEQANLLRRKLSDTGKLKTSGR